jgi:hypothetical protein
MPGPNWSLAFPSSRICSGSLALDPLYHVDWYSDSIILLIFINAPFMVYSIDTYLNNTFFKTLLEHIMKLEDDYKTERGTGSGTAIGYSVQARSTSGSTLIRGQIFGPTWTTVEFNIRDDSNGVPSPGGYDSSGQLSNHGLLSYSSAQAIRWWFHAENEDNLHKGVRIGNTKLGLGKFSSIGIQTRLVQHEVKYSYTITAVSAHDEVKDVLGPAKEESAGVDRAIELATRYGSVDGWHHKAWVIDQMVRALSGDKYSQIVKDSGREWDVGISPGH